MPFIPRKRKQLKVLTKSKKTNKTKNAPITKTSINKMIEKKLQKVSDTKITYTDLFEQKFNATISNITELYNIVPAITQGVADNQRIGNSISPLYTNIRGYVTFSPNDTIFATLGSLDVQMMILRSRTQRDANNRTNGVDLLIMKRGINKIAFDGTFASTCSPINVEDYEILYKKSFKLLPLPGGTSTANDSAQLFNNSNSGSHIYKFKTSINYKKLGINTFKYDAGFNLPQNENIFFCLGYAQYNRPGVPVADIYTPVQVSWTATTSYKDI